MQTQAIPSKAKNLLRLVKEKNPDKFLNAIDKFCQENKPEDLLQVMDDQGNNILQLILQQCDADTLEKFLKKIDPAIAEKLVIHENQQKKCSLAIIAESNDDEQKNKLTQVLLPLALSSIKPSQPVLKFQPNKSKNKSAKLEAKNPNNKKPISPGQALLILLQHKPHKFLAKKIKQLYLHGIENPQDELEMGMMLKAPLLQDQVISKSFAVINNDPSRRYFESHLAYRTWEYSLKKVDGNKLESFIREIRNLFPVRLLKNLETFDNIPETHTFMLELRFFLERIKRYGQDNKEDLSLKTFFESPEDKKGEEKKDHANAHQALKPIDKISIFTKLAGWLPNLAMSYNFTFPMPYLYTEDHRFLGEYGRGRVKDFVGQKYVLSHYMGVLKTSMPLGRNDILFSNPPYDFLKSSEVSKYVEESNWVRHVASRLVHPFSCSISGVMVALVRTCKHLQNINKLPWQNIEEFNDFIKCFIPALVYFSGGHTIYECVAVLEEADVREAFQFIKGFEKTDITALFYDNNEPAFEAALSATLEYNDHVLKQSAINHDMYVAKHAKSSPNPIPKWAVEEYKQMKAKDFNFRLLVTLFNDNPTQALSYLEMHLQKKLKILKEGSNTPEQFKMLLKSNSIVLPGETKNQDSEMKAVFLMSDFMTFHQNEMLFNRKKFIAIAMKYFYDNKAHFDTGVWTVQGLSDKYVFISVNNSADLSFIMDTNQSVYTWETLPDPIMLFASFLNQFLNSNQFPYNASINDVLSVVNLDLNVVSSWFKNITDLSKFLNCITGKLPNPQQDWLIGLVDALPTIPDIGLLPKALKKEKWNRVCYLPKYQDQLLVAVEEYGPEWLDAISSIIPRAKLFLYSCKQQGLENFLRENKGVVTESQMEQGLVEAIKTGNIGIVEILSKDNLPKTLLLAINHGSLPIVKWCIEVKKVSPHEWSGPSWEVPFVKALIEAETTKSETAEKIALYLLTIELKLFVEKCLLEVRCDLDHDIRYVHKCITDPAFLKTSVEMNFTKHKEVLLRLRKVICDGDFSRMSVLAYYHMTLPHVEYPKDQTRMNCYRLFSSFLYHPSRRDNLQNYGRDILFDEMRALESLFQPQRNLSGKIQINFPFFDYKLVVATQLATEKSKAALWTSNPNCCLMPKGPVVVLSESKPSLELLLPSTGDTLKEIPLDFKPTRIFLAGNDFVGLCDGTSVVTMINPYTGYRKQVDTGMSGNDLQYCDGSITRYFNDKQKREGLLRLWPISNDVTFLPANSPVFFIPCRYHSVIGVVKNNKNYIQFYRPLRSSEQKEIPLTMGGKFKFATVTEAVDKTLGYEGELSCGIKLNNENICVAGKNPGDPLCVYDSEGNVVWKQKQEESVARIIQLNEKYIATANSLVNAGMIHIYDIVTGNLVQVIKDQLVSSDAALTVVCQQHLNGKSSNDSHLDAQFKMIR